MAGLERFDKIVRIEQAAIPRMKRSNVATYADVTPISGLSSAKLNRKKNGLCARHFSFNSPGGRCENCEGLGYIDNNMLFFANTEIVCPVCNGSQFRPEVLEVTYKGASIKDVLNLSIEEAAELFADVPKILRILNLLMDVGLNYLQLGQSLTTLSGGECQRLRLA
ncbi:MAG: ABC-ATPase UvrA, partial [[Clostridium] scindens]